MKHLMYGGSTAARTIGCPAWRKLSDKMPPQQGSDFAREGSLLHNCAEEYFINADATMAKMLDSGRAFEGIKLTQDLVHTKLWPAISAVNDILTAEDMYDTYQCEPFVELIPNVAGGSIDMLAVSGDGKTVMVLDYKFGHVTVKAEDNKQMLFYALCAAVDPATSELFKQAEHLKLVIVQPNDDGDICDVWHTPMATIDQFESDVYEAIDSAELGDTEPKSGAWCKYCPAEAVCPVKTGVAQQAMRLNPATVQDLSKSLALIPEISAWIKSVNKLAHEQLESGVAVEGYKLVNKRASRVWSDEGAIAHKIKHMRKVKKDDAYTYKLKSPPQMEKVFKEKGVDPKVLSDYISSVSSGTTIAPSSDKRPDATPTLAMQALADRLK